MNDVMIALDKLTEEVICIARKAGSFLKEERKSFRRETVVSKHAHDYVSYVDKESEHLVVKELRRLLPEAGFITEEGSATYTGEPYCWVVDPLDGTTNFIHDYAPYCVCIALRSRDELLLGVVYDPCLDECFSAWRGGGAWMNGHPLRVSDVKTLEEAFLVTELPYNAEEYRPTARHLLDTLYGRVGALRMIGSAALAICYVAAGRLDGWLEAFIGKWDYSAAALIVEEAGGRVTDFHGQGTYIDGHHIVATNGLIHDGLLEAVQGALPRGV
ncbi:MAG: inositol monophosphatase [Bacteroides sp.]|nr:inositol monophosphatase [Bacteroides sp.]